MSTLPRTRAPFRDRLLRGLEIQPDGCLVWTGSTLKGYGRIRREGRTVYTHRAMYELFAGPIPDDHELDHLCRNPACANVAHLEPVSHQENMSRGYHAAKQTCPAGHALDGQVHRSDGRVERYCKTCNRLRQQRRKSQ